MEPPIARRIKRQRKALSKTFRVSVSPSPSISRTASRQNHGAALRLGIDVVSGLRRIISQDPPASNTYTATHYVAPFASVSGAVNDTSDLGAASWAAAVNSGSPTTLGTAMARAAAPNRVQCAPGTYSAVAINGNRFTPAWFPANSGTSHANNIVFFAQYPAAYYRNNPELWTELSRPRETWWGGGGNINPITGASVSDSVGRNYVYWDGFYINETVSRSGPSAGCVQTQGGSTGIRYRRFLFDRRGMSTYDTWWATNDNGNCFWSQGCTDVRIQDCYFWGDDTAVATASHSCIQTYGSHDFIVENCTSYLAGGLVYFKAAANSECVARYCRAEMGVGVQAYGTQISDSTTFHHCLSRAPHQCLTYYNPDDLSEVNVKSYNMTLISIGGNFTTALYIRGRDTSLEEDQFYNSIVYVNGSGNVTFCELGDSSPIEVQQFDRFNHNVYYRADGGTPRWGIGGASYTPFSNYQSQMAAFGTDPYGDVYESDSIYSDPLFTNYAGGDYTLQAGSPALTAGVGGAICGAYDGTGEVGLRTTATYSLGDIA